MPNPRAQQPLSFDQIIKDAKSLGVPAQALLDALAGGLKGSVTATVGAPADIYNLLNQVSFRGQLPTAPYGSEDISKMLPDVIPTDDKSRQHTAEVGETMGNFIPTPMSGQALKGAVKLGAKGAKALGEEAGRRAVMGESFTPFVNTAIPQTNVMKPKGGNWFKDEVEDKLKRLRSKVATENIEHYTPEQAQQMTESGRFARNDALNSWVDKNLTNYVKKELGTPEDPVRLAIDSRVAEANEKFKVDMARANKFAQRAKEETDPRKQANLQREANRLTAEANNNLELGIKHSSHLPHDPDYLTPEDIKTLGERRKEQGFSAEGMGKSNEAKAYEMTADNSIYPKKASSLQELPEKLAQADLADAKRMQAENNLNAKVVQYLKDSPANLNEQQIKNLVRGMAYDEKERLIGDDTFSKSLEKTHSFRSSHDDYNLKRLENNQYINKLAPDTNIYSAQTGDLGFDHIIDVLKEDLASGRLKPEDLKNISMEQAVRKTADYDLALAKQMQEAQAKKLEGMTVHKEYPEGMRWVQLDKPSQFSAESNAMGHSVRGYEPPKGHPDWVEGSGDSGSLGYGHGGWEAIKSGKAKVYSLVDPKGNPHTTVEIKSPKVYTEDDIGLQFPSGVLNAMKNNGETGVNEYVAQKLKELNSASPTITQIKGKGNGKIVDSYIPYVQDFVKSGNWTDVGDLKNTGLYKLDKDFLGQISAYMPEAMDIQHLKRPQREEAILKAMDAGELQSGYITRNEYESAIRKHGTPTYGEVTDDLLNQLQAPIPPIEGMKKGGAVHISNNPDSMYMELMDKKMKGGGAEDDTKASFGVFPQLKPYRENQDPEASKDMPLQALRGRLAGTLGFIPDMANIPLAVVNAIKGTDYKVPYGTEHYLETLPLKATSPVGKLSGEAGSFFPSTAMIKAQLQGLKGLGKIAGEGLGQLAPSGSGPQTLASQVGAIKLKGGNWFANEVENKLKGLKQSDLLNNIKYYHGPEFEKAREARIKELKEHGNEGALRVAKILEENIEPDKVKGALNQWVDKNLTNYVKKEMATPEDPVRKLAEQGVVHFPIAEDPTYWQRKGDQSREAFGGKQLSQSDLAKQWENRTDSAINVETAQQHQDMMHLDPSLYTSSEDWIKKLSPETLLYTTRGSTLNPSDLGFTHIMDVLKQDLENGRIRPESLKNVSMEQAVRRTYEYDQEMAKKMAEAQFKVTEGMPVHKEYPEGYKWIELAPREVKSKEDLGDLGLQAYFDYMKSGGNEAYALKAGQKADASKYLAEALKYEGDTMGHCVGGYCPDVLEGRSRIFSLRDKKGEPHVTVEVEPSRALGSHANLSNEQKQELHNQVVAQHYGGQEPDLKDALNDLANYDKHPYFQRINEAYTEKYGSPPSNIIQIKGKQNLAPKEQYLPFVQDFVKSGNWSDVGDLRHTGLRHSDEAFGEEALQALKDQGVEIPKYVTMEEAIKMSSDAMNNVGKNLPPVEGMKKGGAVTISDNPDTMFMELMDKKMKGGGAEDNTKLTPSQWSQAQGNKPIEPFTPIEDLTANLKAIANLPSRMYEGAKQLVTDPRVYFADMKAPTAEELAMAFNPSSVGLAGMATKVGKLNAIDALFPNKTESMLTSAEKTALTKYKKDLDVPAVMRRELFRTTGTGDIETPSLKMRPEKGLNPDYLENKYVVPILWDTSGAGTNVSQIAGVPLSQGLRSSTPASVQKQGGRLYPLIEENAQQGVGGASMAGAASSKVNNLNTYSSKGPTVGVVMDMAEHGIDFSHHIAEPYIGMLNALRPSNDALKAFKEAIRKTPVINPITGAKVYPYTKFPGIDSPNIRDIIANGTDDYSAGNIRKAIAEVGDTYAMEKLGFPKWSDIYKTMSMPDAKTGQSAKTILEVKPNTQIVTPNFEHGSYNTGMGATYAGGLADVNNNIVGVPDTVLLKKLFDERLAQGKTIGNVRSSLLKSHHGQLMTAEDIARLREYLGYDKPKKKANGGTIKKAKGGEISEDDIQMEVRPL